MPANGSQEDEENKLEVTTGTAESADIGANLEIRQVG